MTITCNSADSGPFHDYILPMINTCNSAEARPLNDYMLPLIITCNSAYSGSLHDYILLVYRLISAEAIPLNNYTCYL